MAREHARILCSIWSPGDDFRNRGPEAQRLYMLIVSQREINNAGVIPLMISKWARCSAHTTPEDVEKALAELEEHRYVVVDRDTDELLVRTFIRGDGVLKQPNVLKGALRLARQIESSMLRNALAHELVKTGLRDALTTAAEIAPDAVPHDPANPSGKGSANPSANPSRNPSATGERNPSGNPALHPSGTPAGWGGGRGKGEPPVLDVVGVGGRASAPETAPPPPAPAVVDPTNPRCRRHGDVPIDDPGPNCRVCRQVRLRVEADLDDLARRSPPERDSAAAAIAACELCDDHGFRPEGDYGAIRCLHRPRPT